MAVKTVNRIAPSDNGTQSAIIVHPIQVEIARLNIVGMSPLIVHRWSEKAKKMILDTQMKRAKTAKVAKDPEQDFNDSRYISTEGWDGIPAGGFKACLVNAGRLIDGLDMTMARRLFFVQPQGFTKDGVVLIKIDGTPENFESMVRIAMGTADIRFRAMYREWNAVVLIEFMKNQISREQLVNLIEVAGWGEGLCEWRPGAPKSNTGSYGRFSIKKES